ncbi:MAG: hypothetical protein KF773_32260 [Deltaproteobacteria bacterium]|nr:hypothetical protein [Deltaproteobacteria bacterium]
MSPKLVACLTAALTTWAACGSTPEVDPPGTGDFEGLPTGTEQWKRVCATGHGDAITAAFCAGDEPPAITSLAELQALVGLDASNRATTRAMMTGVSTGVGVRTITPLNPRAILVGPPPTGVPAPAFTALAFARGEPLVEMIARDPGTGTLHFFALRFHPACEATAAGCNFADLLTPSIESDWTRYTIYDEETIKNTPLDCLSCHQTDGPGTPKILRMQELRVPWNHWFASNFLNQREHDFRVAHAASYGGIAQFGQLESPAELELFLRDNGFSPQPNEYDSGLINVELRQTGTSAAWQEIYDRAVAGLAIPPPYHDVDPTDPAKVGSMIDTYRQVVDGTLARDLLPDIRDTLLDAALPAMSIRPAPGLDGRGILVHMCARCHNSRLDQTQSRARFNVETLDALDRGEKDLAIMRLQLPDGDPRKMPPPRFHTLSAAERDLAIQALAQ